eukprot:gene1433-1577_t
MSVVSTDIPRLLSPRNIVTFSKYVFGSDEEIIAEYQSLDKLWFFACFLEQHLKSPPLPESGPKCQEEKEAMTHLLVTDQKALEQQIRFLTGLGGIIGITQNEAALERYLLIAPEVKRIVEEFKECFEADQRKERKEHHQDSCSTRSRLHSNAEKLRGSILKHCKENPFSSDIPLMNIKSSMILPPLVARNVIERDKKGNEAYISFVNNRLVADTAEVSMWDPIKKMTLKLFSNWQKKAACKVKDKIIKLREDRQLIARFLVIQKSRPNLSEKLNYVIATYEFSMIPRSLFSGDEVDNSSLKRVCSIDAMAVVQAIKKGTNMSVFADFVKAFVNSIRRVVHGYDEGRVIFDCYIESSLKAQTRAKCTSKIEPVRFDINVAYGTSTYSNQNGAFGDAIANHSHEEADTLIPLHVIDAFNQIPQSSVDVRSPDTNVFIILMDLCARNQLPGPINFITGQGTLNRTIVVDDRCASIGLQKAKALIGLHALSDLGEENFGLEQNIDEIQYSSAVYSPPTKKVEVVVPRKCLELPAPEAVLELVKCGCKGCSSRKSKCSCLMNDLNCTDLCKCHDCENMKDYTLQTTIGEDSDSDNGDL